MANETSNRNHRWAVLAAEFERRAGREVQVLATRGSVENRNRLRTGDAEPGIVQGGSVTSEALEVVAPIYDEVVHVVVRKGGGIERVSDLAGRRVVRGPEGSGMRESALAVLRHYGVEGAVLDPEGSCFLALATNRVLEAAIVTTGLLNPDLNALLGGGGDTHQTGCIAGMDGRGVAE